MPELLAVPSCSPGELVGYEAPMSVRRLLLSSCGQSEVWIQKMGMMGIAAVASRTTDGTKTLETFIFSFNFFTFSRFAPDKSMDGQL